MSFYADMYVGTLPSAEMDAFKAQHVRLGRHPKTQDVFWLDETDRFAGTYALGTQGYGKSGLLENLIVQDIKKNHAVVVIDPHGDLVDNCLAALGPPSSTHHWQQRTFVLDMQDEDYPFGVNLFARNGALTTDFARSVATERILRIFEVNWPEVQSQQYLPLYLRMAVRVMLEVPGSTLLDVQRFFDDDAFRDFLVLKAAKRDADLAVFWTKEWEKLTETERTRRIQPLRLRLHKLFSGKPIMKNILGQRRTSVDFRRAIEQRQTILVKLPVRLAGDEAKLLGTILVAQLHAAIFSFADLPAHQRPGVSLYIDEFHNFVTSDISELFSEGRKYGMRLTVAHQYRGQLPSYLQNSTITARTKICFHLTPEDSRELAAEFPESGAKVDRNQIETHPVKYLLEHEPWPDEVQVFIDTYLRPLGAQRRHGKITVPSRGFDAVEWFSDIVNSTYSAGPAQVDDPLDYLEHVLREVMRTGDALIPIPPEAVQGYSGLGRGFYRQAMGLRPNDFALSAEVRFPMWLVVPDANDEPRWTRPPESGDEQLWHFLFHLRRTMLYLSEHPIGKVTASNPAAIAQMLTKLPPRAAFVRSGKDTGTIFTEPTPYKGTEETQDMLTTQVRDQTRITYCRPREDVERELYDNSQVIAPELVAPSPASPADHTDQAPRTRWEDVP